jgi:hypothetical protein
MTEPGKVVGPGDSKPVAQKMMERMMKILYPIFGRYHYQPGNTRKYILHL